MNTTNGKSGSIWARTLLIGAELATSMWGWQTPSPAPAGARGQSEQPRGGAAMTAAGIAGLNNGAAREMRGPVRTGPRSPVAKQRPIRPGATRPARRNDS